ncbi:MAG: DegT/DnrJ/EryC1/StrS family aminotransferase [Saprospiraceae bacterium]|nr:DegT/DnrJ/EryC1/StrS family aminotransferase [Saprospiraceae bacterium]
MFDLKHCLVVANATLGIQMVIKSLNLKGPIITTPFTYIATASSIVWESCTPVFIDIDPISLCIDVTKIRKAINSSTSAILVLMFLVIHVMLMKLKLLVKSSAYTLFMMLRMLLVLI